MAGRRVTKSKPVPRHRVYPPIPWEDSPVAVLEKSLKTATRGMSWAKADRLIAYGDLSIPIPPGATQRDIRTVMFRTFPELKKAVLREVQPGRFMFLMPARFRAKHIAVARVGLVKVR